MNEAQVPGVEPVAIFAVNDVAEDKRGRLIIDASKVDPVARLGDEDYALFAESTRIKRPT